MAEFAVELARDAATALGLNAGVNCFAVFDPDAEPVAGSPIAFFLSTGGLPPPVEAYEKNPTVQVRVYGATDDDEAAHDLIQQIYSRYHGYSNQVLPSYWIKFGRAIQEPFNLGRDQKNRERYTFNLHFNIYEL